MKTIEMEITCESQGEAIDLTNKLISGNHWVGIKHGKWVLFISCPADEIQHLARELHSELAQ